MTMARKLLLAAVFSHGLLAAASEPTFPASITFNTALPVTEGEGIVRIQSKYFGFGDDSTPLDRDLTVRAVPVVGVWGLSRKVALFGIVPILDKELDVTTSLGRRTRSVSGLGDVTLLARYTAYQRDRRGSTLRVAAFLGVDVPTGEDDESDALGHEDFHRDFFPTVFQRQGGLNKRVD